MSTRIDTPIVLIIYNRPHLVSKVFSVIREVAPDTFFVIADAPIDDKNDIEKCESARNIVNEIDWKSTVYRNYADTHQGCKKRLVSGLTWVFSIVHKAIILEDDCVPDLTFFNFAGELLREYIDCSRIAMISGNNYQPEMHVKLAYSYYFSRYAHMHGWATWKRVWDRYDGELKTWPKRKRDNWLGYYLGNKNAARYWENLFDQTYFDRIDTWDYQMQYNIWENDQLCIMPSVNLVTNIGYGGEATHTKNPNSRFANLSKFAMEFPLSHPKIVMRNEQADYEDERSVYRIYRQLG